MPWVNFSRRIRTGHILKGMRSEAGRSVAVFQLLSFKPTGGQEKEEKRGEAAGDLMG